MPSPYDLSPLCVAISPGCLTYKLFIRTSFRIRRINWRREGVIDGLNNILLFPFASLGVQITLKKVQKLRGFVIPLSHEELGFFADFRSLRNKALVHS